MIGFINLIKPVGMSSNQAVGYIKRTMGLKKVGHAGSLDPLASGVLPIMIGKATKLFDYTLNIGKEYICELEFGRATDTLDTEGNITAISNVIPTQEEILKVLPQFLGNIMQTPPKYSALKIQGKRMYQLARDGEDFDVEQRPTFVYDIRLIDFSLPRARFYIHCKSGFYVRSFCRDIAYLLGSVATMTALVRTSAARLNIKDAITLEEVSNYVSNSDFSFILNADNILRDYGSVLIDDREYFCLRNGMSVKKTLEYTGLYKVYYDNNKFIGIADYSNNFLKMNVLLNE